MMKFVITAYDGEGKLPQRMAVRTRHFEGMERVKEHVLCAGAMLDGEGKMKGSLLVMQFENREELDAYLAQEPYVVEHVWEKIEVERMNVAVFDGEIIQKPATSATS